MANKSAKAARRTKRLAKKADKKKAASQRAATTGGAVITPRGAWPEVYTGPYVQLVGAPEATVVDREPPPPCPACGSSFRRFIEPCHDGAIRIVHLVRAWVAAGGSIPRPMNGTRCYDCGSVSFRSTILSEPAPLSAFEEYCGQIADLIYEEMEARRTGRPSPDAAVSWW